MRCHLIAPASVVAWTVRGLSVLIGLLLALTLTPPASADTEVVRDDTKDGGLRSMTVARSSTGLTVVTYFAEPSDKHLFWVKQPRLSKPTFKIFWRTDRGSDRFVRVTTARRTRLGPAGSGVCMVRRANADAGPASRKMEFTLPPYCLRLRQFRDIPQIKLNQRSLDVSDGMTTLMDALDYTHYLRK